MKKTKQRIFAKILENVKRASSKGIVQSSDILRTDREYLERHGWLVRIIKGWYLLQQPNLAKGDSTSWYSSYWDFISVYLKNRFGNDYCLAANSSLVLHVGITVVPKQLLIMAKEGGSSVVKLPFDTSLFIYQETKTFSSRVIEINGLRVMPLSTAICRVGPRYFQEQFQNAEIALKVISLSELSAELLSTTNLTAAERIIGAYQFLGDITKAEQLTADLLAAGYKVSPENPFKRNKISLLKDLRVVNPHAIRIQAMWQAMRGDVIKMFPKELGLPRAKKRFLHKMDELYVQDAYHSLSIEGYQVTEKLIERIAQGIWDPNNQQNDHLQLNALAAKGYQLAFEEVKKSIETLFTKVNPGKVIEHDLPNWYRTLFSPTVKAGLLPPEYLAGYRRESVFIRGSRHMPLPKEALVNAMEAFFDCLIAEEYACVRAVLGHFIFVFIHPYPDGNGRIARFLMNTMFASGGYPWTIIPVTKRKEYFASLEKASVEQNIKPFAKFVSSLLKDTSRS